MRGQISHQLSFGDGFINTSLYALGEELKNVEQLLSRPDLLKRFGEVFGETLGCLFITRYNPAAHRGQGLEEKDRS